MSLEPAIRDRRPSDNDGVLKSDLSPRVVLSFLEFRNSAHDDHSYLAISALGFSRYSGPPGHDAQEAQPVSRVYVFVRGFDDQWHG